ncbi:caspase family protein [Bradyrhizobium sp.]|uniref:caspase family protein n=1 Tax=Bradyrhizobium sp. TaxID=376 RepID=UPI003C7943F8
MSRFKSLLLCAGLLAAMLGLGQSGAAFAQTANTESASSALREPEQRVALVIGNSRYQNATPLQNPDGDAQSMAQLLNSAGFEVTAATDLTQNDMVKVLKDFSARVAGRGPNTVAMIYYAGHGVQLAGENYLIPVDAKISSPSDLASNSVRLVDLMGTLESIPSRMRIVVLDACRNNPFPTVNDAGRGLAIVDAPNGSIVGYSTAPGTEALDGDGNHSPYTSAFLHVAHEPNLPIEQLFKRVRLEVNNSTAGRQTPWESSSLTSDFYFFGDTAAAATRAPDRGPVVQMASNLPGRSVRQAYDYVLSEGSPEYYREFIELFPRDPLCDHIRALLANLSQATAWHQAVLANSPLAYENFHDTYANSPYAQAALKLQSQPRTMPLMQFTHLVNSPTFKPANPGLSKDNGIKLGGTGVQVHGGNLGATLGDKPPINGKPGGTTGVGGQIVHMPSGTMPKQPTSDAPSSAPTKIVTLPVTGTNAPASTGGAGKIVTLPAGTVGKTGAGPDLKTNGPSNRIVDLPAKSRQQFRTEGLKLNANPPAGNRLQGDTLSGKVNGSIGASSSSRTATMPSGGPVQSFGQGHGGFMH